MEQKARTDLTGKVAIVVGTGESAVAMAQALGAAGAGTVLVGSDDNSLEAAINQLQASGCQVQGIVTDCSDKEQVVQLTESVKRQYGRIDVLVNAWEQFERGLAVDIEPEAWRDSVRIHIKAVFLACQTVGKQMLEQGEGSIINLSSTAGSLGLARTAAFAACKGGVDQLTRVLGAEWIRRGVRVNAIASWSDALRLPAEEEWFRPDRKIPSGRFTQPADLAGTVVYLASSASASVAGQIVHVDGGYAAQ
jgi:gluconate 5-dehydrogenase